MSRFGRLRVSCSSPSGKGGDDEEEVMRRLQFVMGEGDDDEEEVVLRILSTILLLFFLLKHCSVCVIYRLLMDSFSMQRGFETNLA